LECALSRDGTIDLQRRSLIDAAGVNPEISRGGHDMTAEQRARYSARQSEYQRRRYHSDEDFRRAHIERVKRCTVKKAAAELSAEQLAQRRATDAARQARHRAAKKAAATATL
jgi:hypothetical protein